MGTRKKRMALIACAAFAFIALTGCLDGDIGDLVLTGVDLAKVENGQYEGAQETRLIKVTVLVTVADHAITGIKIARHDCGRGKKAERIVDDVIAKQETKVDTVSGATGSSVVILKAVENALRSADCAR